jgi:hypothetical protein
MSLLLIRSIFCLESIPGEDFFGFEHAPIVWREYHCSLRQSIILLAIRQIGLCRESGGRLLWSHLVSCWSILKCVGRFEDAARSGCVSIRPESALVYSMSSYSLLHYIRNIPDVPAGSYRHRFDSKDLPASYPSLSNTSPSCYNLESGHITSHIVGA